MTENDRERLLKEEAVTEAVLFAMGRAVEARELAAALGTGEETARAAVLRLMERYDRAGSGLYIMELSESYQMCTKAEYYENLIRVAKAPKKQALSDVVLETLSIIAYKQPITKIEIEQIRGVKSDHAVNRLIEYNLVYEVGRLDAPGRPALFATTEEFLRRFGVGSMEDLPVIDPEQLDEFKLEVEEELQMNPEELQAVLDAAKEKESAGEEGAAKEEPGSAAGPEGGERKEPGSAVGPEGREKEDAGSAAAAESGNKEVLEKAAGWEGETEEKR